MCFLKKKILILNLAIFWEIKPHSLYVNVSEERITSIFRVKNKLNKKPECNVSPVDNFAPKHQFTYGLHGAVSQKMTTFIIAAVRTPSYIFPTFSRLLGVL
jgi:hypothetical protein